MKSNIEIRLLRVAEEDLTDIIDYIATDNISAANDFLNRIESTLSKLSEFPHLGTRVKEIKLHQSGCRFFVVDNYLIFYTIETDLLLVHRILHGARDYLSLLR